LSGAQYDEIDGDSAPERALDRRIEFFKQFHDPGFAHPRVIGKTVAITSKEAGY
jgi:hypothetical protein